eukprot:gene14087-15559_t
MEQGYSENFINQLKSSLKCSYCKLALRDPLQTECGHRLCTGCYNKLFRENGSTGEIKCPADGSIVPRNQVYPDRFVKREIQNLDLYCKYRDSGCEWMGILKNYEDHMKHCRYEDIECTNDGCTQIIPRHLLEKHLRETCPLRLVSCEFCKEKVPKSKLEIHYEDCPKYLMDCPNKCGKTNLTRKDLTKHLEKNCPLAISFCPFVFADCTFKGNQEEIEKHLHTEITKHVKMAGEGARSLTAKNVELNKKLEVEARKVQQLEERLLLQGADLARSRKDLNEMQSKLNEAEDAYVMLKYQAADIEKELALLDKNNEPNILREIDDLKSQTQQLEQKLDGAIRRSNEPVQQPIQVQVFGNVGPMSLPTGVVSKSNDEIEKTAERIENQLALQDVQMAELNLKLQLLEATSYNGTLIWKIDNYQRRKQDAVMGKTPSLYSPPFYTSRFGYKMCARIYLNGDGQGKGTHISLFFVVMRSEYDALLKWPFPCRITMKLMSKDGPNVSESFRPDPNSSSFRRPSSEMNIASGCPLFVTQSTVASGSFIRKDSIFVKVVVDGSSLPSF